ncbi:unnamed protein product [Paramecium pentaurelia]|uniref:Uncharacterized protein n=1 Tax=Paramecium pentaurelia TaxID=43138 RepID=A0A8S1VZB8_9CILI|nr:unnamed protein product [Paramecium pentaurelia]
MNIQNDQVQTNESFVEENETRYQDYFDQFEQSVIKKKLKIVLIKNKEVQLMTLDGEIVRYDILSKYCNENPEIPFNLEQLTHLQWEGKYKDLKKFGKWTATWKNDIYLMQGMKQGQWKELFKNYYDKAQIYEVGEYINNLRTGIWSVIYENKLIGGGLYNEQGQKSGQWIDLCDYFQFYLPQSQWMQKQRQSVFRINLNDKQKKQFLGVKRYMTKKVERMENGLSYVIILEETQIIYCGEYKNGRKYGIWDILHQRYSNRPFQLIGFGTYNVSGLKNGKWVEQSENFQRMIIFLKKCINIFLIAILSGFGSYDEQGLKNGIWLELSDNYWKFKREVTYYGKYQKDKKIGKWEISFKNCNNPFEMIGGGLYSDSGVKNGYWIEKYESFWSWNEVIYQGLFQNGKQIGRWDLQFRSSIKNDGGGTYDDQNLKNGSWVDQFERFYMNQGYKVLYCHGKKIGLMQEISQCNYQESLKIEQKIFD